MDSNYELNRIFNKNDEDLVGRYLKKLSKDDITITRIELLELMDRLGLDQSRMFAAMGVQKKNYTNEDYQDKIVHHPDALIFMRIARNLIREKIMQILVDFVLDAYNVINCEVIAVWIVRKRHNAIFHTSKDPLNYKIRDVKECILLNKTMLKYNFDSSVQAPEISCYRDDIRSLEEESLTLLPFAEAKIINLQGNKLIERKEKRFKGHRNSDYLHQGVLESMLRIPGISKVPREAKERTGDINRNYFLLSFENKLRKNDTTGEMEVIVPKVIGKHDEYTEDQMIFTTEDEAKAERMKDELMKKIRHLLAMGFHEDIYLRDWLYILKEWEE